MTLEEILSKLESPDFKTFQREALQEAIKQKEVIIPALLKILERVAKEPECLLDDGDSMGHLHALYLLAQFREKQAYPLIVEYFSQLGNGEGALDMTGDIVTEDLGRILASVCDNDLSLIKQIIENPGINEYVRSAALTSLVVLYKKDLLSRQSLVDYFISLINGKLSQEDYFIYASIACCCDDIYPEELYQTLLDCFDRGLIDTSVIGKTDLSRSMEKGKKAILDGLEADTRCDFVNDVIAELEWWACFQPEKSEKPSFVPSVYEQPSIQDYNETDNSPYVRDIKVGRNDPCPCGSGQKYKKCCLH